MKHSFCVTALRLGNLNTDLSRPGQTGQASADVRLLAKKDKD